MQLAKAAVARAIAKLPVESALKFSLLEEGNIYDGGSDSPPNQGCKVQSCWWSSLHAICVILKGNNRLLV